MEAVAKARKDATMPDIVDPDHSAVVAIVSEKFSTEIRNLKDLQAELERRRAEERAAEEADKRKARDAAAKKQETLLESLLTAQVAEAQERAKKQGTVNKLLAALLAIATSGGGAGIWFASQKPTDEDRQREAAPVTEAVEKQSKEVEARVEKNAKKIERLGEIAVEQQVQLSDGVEFIGDKIDAAHPRTADKVDRPKSVDAAKRKAEKIKKRKGAEELFKDEDDPADPFAGL